MQLVQAVTVAVALALCSAAAQAQFFLGAAQPVVFQQQQQPQAQRPLAHRAVVLNAEAEARLPPHLQNPFYKNPRIEAALAKESWFTPQEQQVVDREADKIPREKIFDIFKHAGFIRRRR